MTTMEDGIKESGLEEDNKRNTTMAAGTFNLCKSAIGVGILSLPASMRDAGLILGLFLLLFGSISTTSTLHLLSRISANTGMGDYFMLGGLSYGSIGEISAIAATLLYLFGALIAYATYTSLYVSEFLSFVFKVPPGSTWYTNPRLIIALSAICIYPLACLRDLSKLAKSSVVGLICMGLVCALTVIDFFLDYRSTVPVNLTWARFGPSALRAFSNMLFAYSNHYTMLAVIPKFINPTPQRRTSLTILPASVVFAFYFLVSLFGYLHFGDSVHDNILLAPAEKSLPYAISQLLVATVIILSFPLLSDPAKGCVELLLTKAMGLPTRTEQHMRNFAITAFLVGGAAIVAMFAAKAVLPILGAFTALAGSLLLFIFPSLYFFKLSNGRYKVHHWERVVCYVDIVIGVLLLIFGTYFNVIDTYKTLSGSK